MLLDLNSKIIFFKRGMQLQNNNKCITNYFNDNWLMQKKIPAWKKNKGDMCCFDVYDIDTSIRIDTLHYSIIQVKK